MKTSRNWLCSILLIIAGASANAQSLTPQEHAPHVGVLIFSAYGCGYCAQTAEIIETLRKRYPEDVAIQVKHFPLGNEAGERWAHRAAFALGAQGRLAAMHAALFQVASGKLGHDGFREQAAQHGVDLPAFNLALAGAESESAIDNDRREAVALGVRVTPTVFIDGFKLEGLQQISVYDELIKFRLGQSTAASTATVEVAATAKSARVEGQVQ